MKYLNCKNIIEKYFKLLVYIKYNYIKLLLIESNIK